MSKFWPYLLRMSRRMPRTTLQPNWGKVGSVRHTVRPGGWISAAAKRRPTVRMAKLQGARRTPAPPLELFAGNVGASASWRRPVRPLFPWLYRGEFGGIHNFLYKQNGGRAKNRRHAARRIDVPEKAGAAASRRHAFTWARKRTARQTPNISLGNVRRVSGGAASRRRPVSSGSDLQYRGKLFWRRRSPYEKPGRSGNRVAPNGATHQPAK